MSKKRYPDEFKVEAVKQVVDCGHSVAAVAGYLDMTIVCMPGARSSGLILRNTTRCWMTRPRSAN